MFRDVSARWSVGDPIHVGTSRQGRLRVAVGGYPIPLSATWMQDGGIEDFSKGDDFT